MGGQISAGARDITIENSEFATAVAITGLANSNVTFDHDTFVNINNPGCRWPAGADPPPVRHDDVLRA